MGEVRQKVDLDVLDSIKGLEKMATLVGELDNKTQNLQKSSKTVFSAATDSVENYNKSLGDGVKVYGKIEGAARSTQQSVQKLAGNMDGLDKSMKNIGNQGAKNLQATDTAATKLEKSILQLRIRMDSYRAIAEKATDPNILSKYNRKVQETEREIQKLSNRGKKGFDDMGNAIEKNESRLDRFAKSIVGIFAVGAVLNWAKQIQSAILDVTAEFQKFEAVLTTSLGSGSAAERAMLMIQDFAARTPYGVQELTEAYVKLAGRGIRATNKEMEALGDLAASTGKSFDQLTEAVLDAMSGENERLKEFGVLAKRAGETTQYTFKGVTTEVKNSDQAIKEYLISLGQVEGVTGSMAAISETLTGRISNLGDSLDNLWLTIGQQETGVMASFISFLAEAVEFTTDLVATTDQLAKRMAAKGIADFASEQEAELKRVAEQAKKNGQDVQTALENQSKALREQLEADLKAAKAQSEQVEGFNRGILGFMADPQQYMASKKVEAAVKSQAELIEGQLAAITDAQRFVLKDLEAAENKAQQEREQRESEAAKKALEMRKKAQEELRKMLLSLEDQAAKAQINLLDKNSKAYLDAQRQYDHEQIKQLERTIREKQRLAGLDPELSDDQKNQLRILSQEVDKKYYDALYEQQRQQRDKLLELQKDSDRKEMQQLENKYADQIRKAEEAGQKEIAIALKTARDREKALLERSQKSRTLDQDQELARQFAEFSLPDAMTEVEKKRALAERLLDIDIEFAEKRLALVSGSLDKEDRIKALQLENEISRLKTQQNALKENAEKFSLKKLLGLDDEQMKAVEDAVSQSLNQLQDFLAQSVELRRREVEGLTRAIDEKGRELDREIALNKEGFASNVETKQREYDELKQQRQKAMEDQKKAQRQQVLLDSALQFSNLITASSEIFKVLAPWNVIPGAGIALAIGLIATMFATFAASKARAMQAASVPTFEKGGEGSLVKGASHKQGGIDIIERKSGRLVGNMQGGENFYVTNNKATDQFWPYLELINKQDKKGFLSLALDELLSGTGTYVPNPELPKKMQVVQQGAKQAQMQGISDRYFKEMNGYLKGIAQNTQQGPSMIDTPTERIYKSGNRTTIIKK